MLLNFVGTENTILFIYDFTLPRYTVTSTEEVTFTWAFQKMDYSDSSTRSREDGQSFTMVDDMARLYSVNVTNTLGGGAATCQLCPKGATIEG